MPKMKFQTFYENTTPTKILHTVYLTQQSLKDSTNNADGCCRPGNLTAHVRNTENLRDGTDYSMTSETIT